MSNSLLKEPSGRLRSRLKRTRTMKSPAKRKPVQQAPSTPELSITALMLISIIELMEEPSLLGSF